MNSIAEQPHDSLRADLTGLLAAAPTDLWEPLRRETVFLTGGTGFFGRWLLESFLAANVARDLRAHAVVLTRDPASFRARVPMLADAAPVRLVRGDVRALDAADVRQQLGADAPARFAFVIHAATETDARRNAAEPLAMLDTIVAGTRAALDFARAAGARRFLLTSSGAVYGAQPPGVSHLSEEFPGAPDVTCFNPLNAYGEGKRLAELLCAAYHGQHGLETVTARAFAFVGPHLPLDAHFAIGNFLGDALAGRPVEVRGDGTAVRSYLHAADLVRWLWTILLRGTPGRAYNVGSGDGRPLREIAEIVANAVHPPVPVRVQGVPDPTRPAARYVPDVGRAARELDLRETFDLPTALARTVAWHRQSPRSPSLQNDA